MRTSGYWPSVTDGHSVNSSIQWIGDEIEPTRSIPYCGRLTGVECWTALPSLNEVHRNISIWIHLILFKPANSDNVRYWRISIEAERQAKSFRQTLFLSLSTIRPFHWKVFNTQLVQVRVKAVFWIIWFVKQFRRESQFKRELLCRSNVIRDQVRLSYFAL